MARAIMKAMYSFLSGKLLDIAPVNKQTVKVTLFVAGAGDHGIGYGVFITQTQGAEYQIGDQLTLWIHHHYNEKVNELYGFADKRGRTLFQRLLAVSGVGPKVALSILSTYQVEQVREIIDKQQAEKLRAVSGLGAKTAAKIIVELSSDKDFSRLLSDESSSTGESTPTLQLIRSTLERLGYRSYEIELLLEKHQERIRDLSDTPDSIESIIKLLLQDGH